MWGRLPAGLWPFARPWDFFDTLGSEGVPIVDTAAFPDHHRYTAEDVRGLTELCRTSRAAAFLTTEKDAVKLIPELRVLLEAAAPLLVAELEVSFVDPEAMLRDLEARIS